MVLLPSGGVPRHLEGVSTVLLHAKIFGGLATACLLQAIGVATASPTTIDLTIHPDYPGLQGAGVVGVDGDYPAGWGGGSWQANVAVGAPSGMNFTSIILSTMDLFGRDDVRVEELASVHYLTKKDGPEGAVDWFFQFYTKPYVGSPGAGWYGHRINAEPYFSENLNAPAGQWNQWVSEAATANRLRFYDSSNNYFGGYSDPFLGDLATLTYPIPAWNLNDPFLPLGPQEISFLNLGLGTGWAGGFTGQIDGIRIELTDGSVATVNLEPFLPPAVALNADASCYDAGVGDTVTVTIDLTGDGVNEIVGGQFFMEYDETVLSFVSADPGPGPFSMEVFEFSMMPGELDYAVGVPFGDPGTTGDATMAVLTFTALQEVCDAADLITFRFNVPPSRLTDNFGSPVNPDFTDLSAVTIDGTAPMFTFAPSDLTIECDESSDPSNTGQATASDNCDASPVVAYSDMVAAGSCPQASVITRTWTATDACGNEAVHVQTITVADTTAPVFISVPADIMVNADAGFCSALVDVEAAVVETFDDAVVLSPTQAPDVWYTDRYAPFAFESVFFDGGNRLRHSIDASDCSPCRPGGFGGGFYDTQGRKYDTPGTTAMSIDLYVPTGWDTTERRMAGFWGTGFNASSAISLFPIIEFTSDGGVPRFRAWPADPVMGGWIDLGLPTGFAYDSWYTLEMTIDGSTVTYNVGDLTLTLAANGTVEFGNVILQGHNNTAGVTYDIYWDNFTTLAGAVAVDNCDPAAVVTYERSDNAMLSLSDPFPAGTTTVTWTATDACGNFSTAQTLVTVNAVNELVVDVELLGLNPGLIDRCITFELSGGSGTATASAVLSFSGGVALGAVVEIPCGDWNCITARDELHTLRSIDVPMVVGLQYVASFTGADGLVGGDLNDDGLIDILDFGVFVSQFGTNYGTPDTDCLTPFPHADLSGSGDVNAGDFTFIQQGFLEVDAGICFTPLTMSGALVDGRQRPRTRISVRELASLQLTHIAVADLNGDGWVDTQDIALFVAGARP
jgi:hypothetical protein